MKIKPINCFVLDTRVQSLKQLDGPIYKIDRQHHFAEIEYRIESLRDLVGPKYEIDSKHHFNEVEARVKVRCFHISSVLYNTLNIFVLQKKK